MVSNPFVPRMLPKWAISTPAQGALTGTSYSGSPRLRRINPAKALVA
jgi:hypothetical protein